MKEKSTSPGLGSFEIQQILYQESENEMTFNFTDKYSEHTPALVLCIFLSAGICVNKSLKIQFSPSHPPMATSSLILGEKHIPLR